MKSRDGKSQRREEKKKEDQRKESEKKKIQMREKVGKSRDTTSLRFSNDVQCRRVENKASRLAKVRSQLAR